MGNLYTICELLLFQSDVFSYSIARSVYHLAFPLTGLQLRFLDGMESVTALRQFPFEVAFGTQAVKRIYHLEGSDILAVPLSKVPGPVQRCFLSAVRCLRSRRLAEIGAQILVGSSDKE